MRGALMCRENERERERERGSSLLDRGSFGVWS